MLLESTSDLLTLLDLDGQVLYQNPASEALLGQDAETLTGRSFFELVHPEDRKQLSTTLDGLLAQGGDSTATVRLRLRHGNGAWLSFECQGRNLVDNPVVGGIVLSSRDLTERQRAETALRRERAYFEQLFRNSPSGIVILDPKDRIVDANRAFVDLFQVPIEQLTGQPLNRLIVPPDLQTEARQLSKLVHLGQDVAHETVRQRHDGSRVDVAILAYSIELEGRHLGIYGIYTDITERKKAERKLFREAFHDPLTGLPNRALLQERLERNLRRSRRRSDYDFALFFLDLDGFKAVNDRLGHAAGDLMLVEIARRIQRVTRPGDTVARLGGDEFTIILEDIHHVHDAVRVAERLIHGSSQPFDLAGHPQHPTVSLGIAFSSSGYDSVEELMRDADIAMYRAKARGPGRFEIFDDAMQQEQIERRRLHQELEHALAEGQLELFYQPIVQLASGRPIGFEAQIRWHHPRRGLILPAQLRTICRETDLSVALGRWRLGEICRQMAAWQSRFPEPEGLSTRVDLTARELRHPDFLTELDWIARENVAKPATLGFEIHEDLVSESEKVLAEVLWQIHRRAYRLHVRGYGTGQSSLSALHRLPLESLKVDRSFVMAMEPGSGHLEVLRAAAALGESLDLAVGAEGVEELRQADQLAGLGFDFAQGAHYCPAVPEREASELIATATRW